MNTSEFWKIYNRVIDAGWDREINWSENLKPCRSSMDFCYEYIWVVLNSGMKNQIARKIMDKINAAIQTNRPVREVFKHKGKATAIEIMLKLHKEIFAQYQAATDKMEFLKTLDFIGDTTKYHLAKNLGIDVAKPDRHLKRIAAKYNTSCFELCAKLSAETGLRVATVDVVLWRAANLGWL